jgi:hypothetical protein
MDVWEHAYYLTIKTAGLIICFFIEHLINWDFVNADSQKVSLCRIWLNRPVQADLMGLNK